MNRREFVELGIVGLPLTVGAAIKERNSETSANAITDAGFAPDLSAAQRVVADYDLADDIQPRFFPSLP